MVWKNNIPGGRERGRGEHWMFIRCRCKVPANDVYPIVGSYHVVSSNMCTTSFGAIARPAFLEHSPFVFVSGCFASSVLSRTSAFDYNNIRPEKNYSALPRTHGLLIVSGDRHRRRLQHIRESDTTVIVYFLLSVLSIRTIRCRTPNVPAQNSLCCVGTRCCRLGSGRDVAFQPRCPTAT